MSKYLEFGSMPIPAFAKSNAGVRAKFLTKPVDGAVQKISSQLKSVCVKYGTKCEITSTNILVECEEGVFRRAHVIDAVIIK